MFNYKNLATHRSLIALVHNYEHPYSKAFVCNCKEGGIGEGVEGDGIQNDMSLRHNNA
jgi:hypothetical protein